MKESLDGRRDVWGPFLALQLKAWSDLVFRPAAMMQKAGLYRPSEIGKPPRAVPRGGGRALTLQHPTITLLEKEPDNYDRLREFDIMAAEYRMAVEPYSEVLFHSVLPHLERHVVPTSRILDPACGPGREAHLLAARVPEGEVIAADLSRAMIQEARRSGKRVGVENVAYYQTDAARPPESFWSYFDLVYCQLSFHFFPDGRAVAEAFLRVLAPGGTAFVVDPGPAWFNTLSGPLAALANPAFVQYRTGEEFCALFKEAGFSETYWTEMLPGMGLTIASA